MDQCAVALYATFAAECNDRWNTAVRCRYSAVNFPPNFNNRHPIARPLVNLGYDETRDFSGDRRQITCPFVTLVRPYTVICWK